jgi:hypothetical protein
VLYYPRASGRGLPAFVSNCVFAVGEWRCVTILLGTLNGERFLPEQLASLERQTFKNWKVIASDGGSLDRTKSILDAFQKSFEPGKVEIIAGPGLPQIFFSWPAWKISTATSTPLLPRRCLEAG